jgi:hypothetical protein
VTGLIIFSDRFRSAGLNFISPLIHSALSVTLFNYVSNAFNLQKLMPLSTKSAKSQRKRLQTLCTRSKHTNFQSYYHITVCCCILCSIAIGCKNVKSNNVIKERTELVRSMLLVRTCLEASTYTTSAAREKKKWQKIDEK